MKHLPLSKSIKTAIVSDEDYDNCARKSWMLRKANSNIEYAICQLADYRETGGKKITTYLHQFILGKPPEDMEIDHIDGNGLNNQRENLQFVTHKENMMKSKNSM